MKYLIISTILACSFLSYAQKDLETQHYLENLFSSGRSFTEITSEADAHFRALYPNLDAADLVTGSHRDGNYVKYQRWKSYYRHQLREDGTIGSPISNGPKSRGLDDTYICNGDEFIADWNNINYVDNMGWQIDQGRTNCIAFHPTDPDVFFVGAAFGGLWKSTDGGQSYFILNDDLPMMAVSGIALDPNDPDHIVISLSDIVWYGPYGVGVYESTDGGLTFNPTSIDWDIEAFDKIYYMDQHPTNPSNIIIATNIGVYKTTDFFATNTMVQGGNMHSVKYSFADPNIVYAGNNSGRFYRSTDGGDSFTLVDDFGNGQVRIAVPRVANSSRIAVTHGTYLQRSFDDGQTFETLNLPENNMVVEFQPQDDNTLLVGNFEVWRSDDFGDNFNEETHWLGDNSLPFIHVDQRNVFVNPYQGNSVYFCNDGGIFAYDFNNNSFANLSSGLIITQYYDIAVSQSEDLVLGAGSQDNGNVFRASDGTWDRYAQTGDGMGQDIDPNDADTRYWSYQNGGLRRWQFGSNSNIAPPGKGGNGAWETPFKLDPNNSNRLFVGYDTVFVSDDQGDNWTNVGDMPANGNLYQLAIAPSNSDHLYVTRDNNFYEYDGVSGSWDYHLSPSTQEITDLEVDHLNEERVYICYNGYTDGNKIHMSEDGGETWTNITYNLPNLPYLSLELYENTPGGVFVGTYGAVYYLDDSMTEWRKFGCIPNTAVNDIEIQYQTNRIFIGTHGRGIFYSDIDFEVASIETNEGGLEQLTIYPNPADNVIYIKSDLAGLDNYSVQLYDMLGREHAIKTSLTENGQIAVNVTKVESGNYLLTVYGTSGESKTFHVSVL